jgi:short-subunit dehydrogenase
MYKTILITGASSGIGKDLAESYAALGVTLILTGRDKDRLNETQKICRERGATVISKIIDVTDQKAMEKWITEVDQKNPVDLIIANAGIRALLNEPDLSEAIRVIDTNVNGVLNTIIPIIPLMKQRQKGHIAVVSSLAAYFGYPKRGPYGASKAAVKILCQAWRIELKPYNITVSTICPGFVKTPLTASINFKMPMMLDVSESSNRIIKGLSNKKTIIAYPFLSFLIARIIQCLPTQITDYLLTRSAKRVGN